MGIKINVVVPKRLRTTLSTHGCPKGGHKKLDLGKNTKLFVSDNFGFSNFLIFEIVAVSQKKEQTACPKGWGKLPTP